MTYHVIIVGGGMAGLAAAHTLTHLGRKVAILEASPQLGGRAFHLTQDKSLASRIGALSIQSKESQSINPLQGLLQRHRIKTKALTALNSETFDTQGNKVSLSELHASLDPEYHKALMRIQDAKRQQRKTFPSLSEILNFDEIKGLAVAKTDSPAYWARKFITATITQHTGAPLHEVSLLELMQDELGNAEDSAIIGGSYKLIEALLKEAEATGNLTLQINTKVMKVQQTKDKTRETESSAREKPENSMKPENLVVVFDQAGNRYEANAVIIAVPFSVLKKGVIQFIPELSVAKQTALNHFGVAAYNSVALEFESVFWDETVDYLFPNGPDIEDWPQYLNASHCLKDKKPLLIAQFSGERARFGNKPDAVIIEEALAPLKRVYGDAVTPLKSYHISRFDVDPNILGGSLYCSKKNSSEDFAALCKSENACYFAGDYTYAKRHGRLESAFESGLQSGLEVDVYLAYLEELELLRKETRRPKR